MLELVFVAGLVIFGVSSIGFYVTGRGKRGLNAAFLVSFVTLISYLLMWQGDLTVTTGSGQPIFWSRWLFYGLSCTLLMVEIGELKGIEGGALTRLVYLTAVVMVTGFLAARDLTPFRWAHVAISSVAYALVAVQVLGSGAKAPGWVNATILFGWTAFPVVFILAPTGVALIGSAVANLLYLVLDIYTKIVFNVRLSTSA